MRPPGSASARFGLFALLVLSSLALKAAVGPPGDGSVDARPGEFERTASDRLEAQHFTVEHRTPHIAPRCCWQNAGIAASLCGTR